jgi:serine/threonine protein kinase
MIMELMDGDLFSLMQERLEECVTNGPPFNISEAVHIMLQVAEGMLFLHAKQIVHRDLKSRNILIKHMKATEVSIRYVHAKVADFGLSRTKEKSMTYSNQTLNQGTTRWMAPEMIKIGNEDDEVEVEGEEVLKYPFKVDVYSFGMVGFEILSGHVPFPTLTPKEARRMVLGGERPPLPDVCPERLRCLMEACWRPEPNERPRFGDICAELRDLTCAHYMTCNCLDFKPSILFCSR